MMKNSSLNGIGGTDGLSLIEFMVAILLSTVVIGGAVSIYLVSKSSYLEVEQVAAASENARFSMQVMTRSLRHVRFFGPAGFLEGGELNTTPVDGISISDDCSAPAEALDPNSLVFGADLGASDTSLYDCIDDARPGTDVLVVKHLEPSPIYDADPNNPTAARDGAFSFPTTLSAESFYVAANSEQAIMFFGGTASDIPDVSDGQPYANAVAYPYAFNVYYVREDTTSGVPKLSRKTLEWNGASMAVVTEDLVEGLENLQVLFGEDNDGDGSPNRFSNASGITDWDTVVSAKVYAIARSIVGDSSFTDDRTYTVGDTTWTPTCSIMVTSDFNECQFRRLLVQAEINLRNPQLVIRSPN